jgi:anaerobic magnesium-protoporphyrin IX monomethyl ester cyclase
MKVLLINPVVREWAEPNCFPLGLGYIAEVCVKHRHEVDVWDMNAERDVAFDGDKVDIGSWKLDNLTDLEVVDYDLIGITGIITQYKAVKDVAERMREVYPDVPIACGGPLATSVPRLMLEATEVDVCVLGEGERTMADILGFYNGTLESLSGVQGICTYEHGVMSTRTREPMEDIDYVAMPKYDLFPMDVYLNNPIAAQNTRKWIDGKGSEDQVKSINIVGTRGCPFNCIYCYHNYMGQGYRKRNVNRIVYEMDYLNRWYGVEYFHFTDDAFASHRGFIRGFCEVLEGRGYQWSCAGRANVMDEDLAKTMADAGCIGICYGLESGSQRMLDVMKKQIKVDQYRRAIELNHKYFSYEDYTLMTNLPTETPEDVQMTIDFCKEMEIKSNGTFFTQCYPGTPLFKRMVEEGEIDVDDLGSFEDFVLGLEEQGEKLTLNLTDYSDEEVIGWHDRLVEEVGT